MKFTIYYKDAVGRKNQTETSGQDYLEAEKKFRLLYPDCVIMSYETKDIKVNS